MVAAQWFEHFEGAGLDGVIAKKWSQKYLPGKRAWVKVKHQRTTDCVVIGFRWSNDRQSLGSLLLGLYDENGTLHYVGHTSSFDARHPPRTAQAAQANADRALASNAGPYARRAEPLVAGQGDGLGSALP